jgi:hypothetical protein
LALVMRFENGRRELCRKHAVPELNSGDAGHWG